MIVLVLKKKKKHWSENLWDSKFSRCIHVLLDPTSAWRQKRIFSLERKPIHKTSSYDTVKVMQQTNVSNMTRLVCTMAFKAMLLIRFEIGGYLSEAPAGE